MSITADSVPVSPSALASHCRTNHGCSVACPGPACAHAHAACIPSCLTNFAQPIISKMYVMVYTIVLTAD